MTMLTFIREIDDIEITYVVGKNQSENHPLIQSSEPDDLWFHLADLPSAHVVAQVAAKTLTEEQEMTMIIKGIEILKMKMKITEPINVNMCYIKNIICLKEPGKVGFTEGSEQWLFRH